MKNDIVKIVKRIIINLRKFSKIPAYKALLVAIGIGFGVLIAAQWQTLPTRVYNPIAPYISLKDTRNILLEEQKELKQEIHKNQDELETLQQELKSNPNNQKDIIELESLKTKAGLTKITGSGISVILDDSKQGPVTDESIIHASDLRDTINLLWGAGAEAITINNERIVTNSSIDCIVNTILINNTRLTAPFVIDAVGNQSQLLSQIENTNNLSDIYRRQKTKGLIINISKVSELEINSYNGSFDLRSGESNG